MTKLYEFSLTAPPDDEAAISRALIEAAKTPSRQQIDTLEAGLLQLPQVDIPVQHRFAEEEGLYAREIVIPRGALMTGRVHKHQHVSIMISGDMTVLTETGMQRVKGYHCWICPPGTKRVGYAHEETRWLTVHHTDHMQPEGIEDALCEPMQALPAPERKDSPCLS